MNGEKVEIVVVGAGPAGLITARESSRRGVRVIVLEEHEEVGLPSHCAGLLSIRGLEEIGAPPNGAYVQNKVRGARFFSPSNLSFTIERKEKVACVVNRTLLDKFLAEQAERSGALIKLNSRVHSAIYDGAWTLKIDGYSKLRAKLLVDAEGALPKVLGMAGLERLKIENLLRGLQVDLKGVSVDPDYVEVHFSRELAPGLFAWVIPLNDEAVRIGLACKGSNPRDRLFKFIKKRFGNVSKRRLEAINFRSGMIITCGPIERTYGDGLLVVGDSAGQVKPITGGGVIFGGKCASIAGRTASEAVRNNRTGRDFLKTYEEEWRAKLSREFRIALLTRRILNRLSDKEMDKIFSLVIREEIYRELSICGDMDLQGTSILKVFKKRGILKFLPIILRAMILS